MRTAIAVVVLALFGGTLGCSKSPRDRLQGKWMGDSISNVSAEQNAEATAWVKQASLEFAGDKLTVTIPAEPARSGEFKVAKVDGKNIEIQVSREGGSSDTAKLAFAETDKIRWEVGDGRQVTLLKVK